MKITLQPNFPHKYIITTDKIHPIFHNFATKLKNVARLIPYILLLLAPSLLFGQRARIDWEKTSHDFGRIPEKGGKVSCEFIFTNRGEAPLLIRHVESDCGCAAVRWPRRPVASGDTGRIVVTFNPQGREGKFLKHIAIYTNATPPNHSLRVSGTVTRSFADVLGEYPYQAGQLRYDTTAVRLGRHPYRVVRLLNAGEKAVGIAEVKVPDHLEVHVTFKKLRPKEEGYVTIALRSDTLRHHHQESEIVLLTDERKEIRVNVTIVK